MAVLDISLHQGKSLYYTGHQQLQPDTTHQHSFTRSYHLHKVCEVSLLNDECSLELGPSFSEVSILYLNKLISQSRMNRVLKSLEL